ncbi:MAG: TonB-dependent receptor plug domain-containing protein [Prevotella sp.]
MKSISTLLYILAIPSIACAQTAAPTTEHDHTHEASANDSTQVVSEKTLGDVNVVARRSGVVRLGGALNGQSITRNELFKAACCNLGESFVNNPSVDVNYSDATTGARQIKLLGLSGTYVQMLTENLPNFRGAALPYGLSYVPGNWMKSIQVSKGNSSVKNGYEAMTGQINVEYVKPEDEQGVRGGIYTNTMGRLEADADANLHIGSKDVSTELLAHFQNGWSHHDGNDDGFQDDPQVRQYNFQNRWYVKKGNYLLHAGISLLNEDRQSGQAHHQTDNSLGRYRIDIATDRYEGYMKHAFIIDPNHGGNIALLGSLSMHLQDATFGNADFKSYYVNEKNAYGSLMYETHLGHDHSISTGLSLNYDYLHQNYRLNPQESTSRAIESETTPGAYFQYTFNHANRIVAMAGVRVDHSNVYGTFVTPRMHIKWTPTDILSFRASVGKGYRSPRALAENSYLIASGRTLVVDKMDQEAAWNYGISASLTLPINNKMLKVNAEYYYTDFLRQMVIDYDSDPQVLHITNLDGRSYSHTFQIDASYPFIKGLELTAAYRYNMVKSTYGGHRLWKPLQSRYKALLTASYKTPLALWQFDATFVLNGGGRMPEPYLLADGTSSWNRTFKAYPQLNLQVKREFRHFSVFVGGENLTNYKQKNPIVGSNDPWSSSFDPTMVYGPVSGAMGYIGARFHF